MPDDLHPYNWHTGWRGGTADRLEKLYDHGLLVGCLTSQQHASVSLGWICSDNFTCCHTEIEVADQTFHLTQSQYTDTGPTSPSTDPIIPGAWQGSHWSANFEVTGMTRPRKKSRRKQDSNPGFSTLEADALTTRPTSQSYEYGQTRSSQHCGWRSTLKGSVSKAVLGRLLREMMGCILVFLSTKTPSEAETVQRWADLTGM